MINVDSSLPSNLIYVFIRISFGPLPKKNNNKQLKNEIIVLFSVTNLIPENAYNKKESILLLRSD